MSQGFTETTDLPGHTPRFSIGDDTTGLPPYEADTFILAVGDTLDGVLDTSRDNDVVGVNVTEGTNYSIWLTNTGADTGTHPIEFEDGVDRPDTSWDPEPGRYDFTATQTGTMYFEIFSYAFEVNDPEPYTFQVLETTFLDETHDAPGDETTPYRVLADGTFRGYQQPGDSDWVGIELVAGHIYTFDVAPVSGNIAYSPVVYDQNGVAQTTPPGWLNFPLTPTTYRAEYSGLHFIDLYNLSPSEQRGDFYELQVTDFGNAENSEVTDAAGGSNTIYSIAAGGTFSGTLEDSSDYDAILIDAKEGTLLEFTLEQTDANDQVDILAELWGSGFDPLQSVLETNGTASFAYYFNAPGTYYLSLNVWNGFAGADYTVSLTGTSAPDLDEIVDAPGIRHSDFVISPGDSFRGWAEKVEDDIVPIMLEGGESYLIQLRGHGTPAISDGALQILDANSVVATQQTDTNQFAFVAPTSGLHYISISTSNGFVQTDPGFYALKTEIYDGIQTGTDSNEKIVGIELAEVLDGLGGNDTIVGDAGSDTISGGLGDDEIYAGYGDDDVKGGAGSDFIEGSQGHDLLRGGRDSDRLYGGNGNDSLRGQREADFLDGHFGDDNLKGGGGNDTLFGGDGDDFLRGGTRRDELYGSDGSDYLIGNGFDDTLIGGQGDDFLKGGGDNDRLAGGEDWDILKGGTGSDVFVFEFAQFNEQIDLIVDFSVDEDRLEFTSDLSGGRDAEAILSGARDVIEGQADLFRDSLQIFYPEDGVIVELSEWHWLYFLDTTSDELQDAVVDIV